MTRPTTPPAAPAPSAPPAPPEADRPAPHPSVGTITVGLLLVALGTLALLVVLGVEVPLAVVGPALLLLLGGGVIVSGVRGEPSGGLLGLAIALGVVLAVGTFVGAVVDVPLAGGVGDRVHEPTTTADLADEYRLGMGTQQLDMTGLELPPGTTTVALSTVIGQAEVIVPPDVAVSVRADVAAGATRVLGRTVEGVDLDTEVVTPGWEDAERRLVLDIDVLLGEARVRR